MNQELDRLNREVDELHLLQHRGTIWGQVGGEGGEDEGGEEEGAAG